ncbi:hypothetical protein CEXT_488911 [Caerostris extrusa]|uniref:Uncharacterized protein n=1 Tax=Caerostris extrusa TaxID=172846 RepID=A0AAV4RYR4_CAEEX|nr:hypothetical protein CEXT_488911 [Caerostris extrusa]
MRLYPFRQTAEIDACLSKRPSQPSNMSIRFDGGVQKTLVPKPVGGRVSITTVLRQRRHRGEITAFCSERSRDVDAPSVRFQYGIRHRLHPPPARQRRSVSRRRYGHIPEEWWNATGANFNGCSATSASQNVVGGSADTTAGFGADHLPHPATGRRTQPSTAWPTHTTRTSNLPSITRDNIRRDSEVCPCERNPLVEAVFLRADGKAINKVIGGSYRKCHPTSFMHSFC